MATIYTRAAKGSALTWTEGDANITNLNDAKIEDIVEDTTPQLGGDLDVNGFNIISTANGDIDIAPNGTGKIVLDGLSWPTADGAANYVLKTDGAGSLSWVAQTVDTNTTYAISAETATGGVNLRLTGSDASTDDVKFAAGTNISLDRTDANTITINNTAVSGIATVSADTSPELGGNLDLNSYKITNSSVGTPSITLEAGDGGDVVIEAGALIPKEGILLNTADLTISAGSTYNVKINSITYPKTDGSANQFLKTNGSGVLSFASIVQATGNELEAVADDPAPSLGGNLNVGVYSIVSSSNGNIAITPNGTGKVVLDGLNWPTADGTNGQVLKTDGAGNLTFTTITSGITDVVQDTTPQLGGNLDVNGQQIVSVSNGNISIQPNGTGQTVVKNLEYNENIYSLGTTSGTITPDAANGNVQTITLNGNLTFSAFSNPVAGQSITLIVNTNGTGRTLTSTMKFAGGTKTISTTSTTDIISVFYDGTNYWASLSTDFK